jgi:hypothetical protein
MGWTRLSEHGKVRRTAAVDAYEFPGSVRQRFATHHEELTADDIRTVEAAARQWFRLAARHPRTRLSMPSLVVDDLWHEMVLHTVDYAAFCEAALGRFLHHVPESAMASSAAAANRSSGLLATFHLARQDEGGGPDQLPLLFRVDHQLAVEGGRHYLADCGGRGECHELPGTLCLQHLTGVGNSARGSWDRIRRRDGYIPPSSGVSCAGGCGGG